MKKVRLGKARQAFRGKGFAIALVLSLVAVGASTYIAYDRALSKISLPDFSQTQDEDEIVSFDAEDGAPVAKVQEDIPKNAPVQEMAGIEAAESKAAAPEEVVDDAGNFIPPKAPRVMPVDGEVINKFSNGELVKSKTLGVWKTHDGIDIAAPLNTPVVAATNGTVTEVFSDPLWGICVVVDHSDGRYGHYYGLDKNVTTSVGQKVNSGDKLGMIGNTAEIEIAEEPHLHFAIKNNDAWIDPFDFINNI
ncbi:MAG: M23 family metallopeptidase [Eubacterium sp.]|jgi:murein DD-endopeptidase MepM/ murein hydrolase activator NlpD|nr:M23 family metallopeptidase [Eubacterium sp.]